MSKVSCIPPTTLKVSNLKSTSATITAASACDAPQYLVQLSTDATFENDVVEQISERFPSFKFDSLSPSTKYYAKRVGLVF